MFDRAETLFTGMRRCFESCISGEKVEITKFDISGTEKQGMTLKSFISKSVCHHFDQIRLISYAL
jgi:hypothetical protein